MQQVALWCLYIGIVCAVCGRVWCLFEGVCVQQVALWCLYIGIVCVCCVWDSLVWVLVSECAAGGFLVFVYRHCVCCVWDIWCGFGGVSVQQVALCCLYIGIVCVLCVGEFGVGLGEMVCSRRLCGVCISALCVCCVWDSLEWVWGSKCAAGGFVVFVYRHCVCVCVGEFDVGFGE